jgi:hypothetical protein
MSIKQSKTKGSIRFIGWINAKKKESKNNFSRIPFLLVTNTVKISVSMYDFSGSSRK